MQFSITIISMLSAVAVALPGPTVEATSIMRRTCGTLTGDALSACQTACKALCVSSQTTNKLVGAILTPI